MAVDRRILQQALGGKSANNANAYDSDGTLLRNLQDAQGIQQVASDPANFGSGRAGVAGLAAQLGTSVVGAYSRYKAEKSIADKEVTAQQAFAQKYPQFADLASQLSPATREAYNLKILENDVNKNNPLKQLEVQKTQAEINKLNAETNSDARNNGHDPKTIFGNASQLRGEYLNNSKTFNEVKNGYERVSASTADPSPSGDLGIVFGFMKTVDPGSTVRESEQATVENARGVPESVRAKWNKILEGERLTAEQRNDFVGRSKKFYDQAGKSHQKMSQQYVEIAKRNKINPDDVIIDFSTTVPADRSSPATSPNAPASNQNITPVPHPEAANALEILKQRGVIK